MSDVIFKAAAWYAAQYGWPLVQIYGMRSGVCMCRKGAECGTPGKHPIHDEWLSHVTTNEDVIASWFEGGQPWNIGLPLGPSSGLVDIEWDDEKSFAVAKRFGLIGIPTVGYSSSRGGHRLWKLDKRLIDLPKGVQKLDGLEVRFGGGGKMSQSIIPPSVHHTGKCYAWEPGMSPDDIEPAAMPEALVLAVIAAVGGDGGGEGMVTKDTIFQKVILEGERHDCMVSWISSEIMRMRDPHSPEEQQNVLMIARALNKTQMADPLKDAEIKSIWQSQLRWGMKARAAGAVKIASTDENADEKVREAKAKSPHTASGLEFRSGEWFPGLWRLTVVHSDPKEFRLGVPLPGAVDDDDDRMRVFVSLTSADWSSPIAVARKVLEVTGTIDVTDPNPKEWAKIWNGYSYKPEGEKKSVKVRGLKVKLMDDRDEEWPPAEQQRYAVVAGWLLDALSNVARPEPDSDDSSPHPSGRPCWVRAGEGYDLYFSWSRVFEDIQKTRKVPLNEGDRISLKRRILAKTGEAEFRVERVRTEAGVKRRYIVWTQAHIAHLEDIAHPSGQEDQKALIYGGQIESEKPITSAGNRESGPN